MLKKQHVKKIVVVCFALILLIASIVFVTGAEGFLGAFSPGSEDGSDRATELLGDANGDSDVNIKEENTTPPESESTPPGSESTTPGSESTPPESESTTPESESTAPVGPPTAPEGTMPDTQPTTGVEDTRPETDLACNLQFSKYGRYTGAYVEDGTDDYVTNVAILMVTNISDKYLEYSVITFDISGTPAAFTVTGLAPGETAWVLEQNRLEIEKDAVFTYMDDITSFKDDNSEASKNVKVTLGDGQLSVENKTDNNLKNVYVYFKLRHSDGNFLGGITYPVPMGDLDKNETASAVAVHCDGATCEVVRVDWGKQE